MLRGEAEVLRGGSAELRALDRSGWRGWWYIGDGGVGITSSISSSSEEGEEDSEGGEDGWCKKAEVVGGEMSIRIWSRGEVTIDSTEELRDSVRMREAGEGGHEG